MLDHASFVHLTISHSLCCIRLKWVSLSLKCFEEPAPWDVRTCYRKNKMRIMQKRKDSYGDSQNSKDPNAKLQSKEALMIYQKTLQNGFAPNRSVFLAALKACIILRDLGTGTKIHVHTSHTGNDIDILVATTLVHMYAKCGSMLQARQVFDNMPQHDLVSWNSVIYGYAENGESECALQLFAYMQEEGFRPNSRTYVAALKACASCAANEGRKQVKGKPVKAKSLEKGLALHSQLSKTRYEWDSFVANTMVDLYAKCLSMEHARCFFYRMPNHDLVSWTSMISGYAESENSNLAPQLFTQMQDEGFSPDARTFLVVLKACANYSSKEDGKLVNGKLVKLECLEKGIAIHSQLSKGRNTLDIFLANTIVDVYAKCGSMDHAYWFFHKMPYHNLVSWTSIIYGYAKSENGDLALQLFFQMQDNGFTPDDQVYAIAFKACAGCASKEDGVQLERRHVKVESLERGIVLQSQFAKSGYETDIFVASTMVDVYAKCGSMDQARSVFDKMPHHELVSWTAMIFGYAENGENIVALQLFACMQDEGFMPDALTYVAALKACGSLAAFETGKGIHVQIRSIGLQNEPVVAASLIGFYGKCGSMADAEQVFHSMKTRDLVTWNALLAGYAYYGDASCVFDLFMWMMQERIQADGVTFLSILNACSHAGIVDKGKGYFWIMCIPSMICPVMEHYACMVDLMGRSNHLYDAVEVVKNMPFKHNMTIWRTVLGACWKWKNVMIGRLAFDSMRKLDFRDISAYMLMANIYAVSDTLEAQAWQ